MADIASVTMVKRLPGALTWFDDDFPQLRLRPGQVAFALNIRAFAVVFAIFAVVTEEFSYRQVDDAPWYVAHQRQMAFSNQLRSSEKWERNSTPTSANSIPSSAMPYSCFYVG